MKRILLITVCALLTCTVVFSQEKNKKEKVKFLVESIHCENCIRKIEKNISFEKGVTDMKCDLEAKTVEITYRVDKTDKAKLISAFNKIGYKDVTVVYPKIKPKE